MNPATLVNTARYPLAALEGSAGAALMESCRQRMGADGVCRLPAFLSGAGLEILRREARALREHAHHSEVHYTPWYAKPDPSLPEDDPRAASLQFSVGYVGRDRLPAAGAIETLFAWEPLLALVRAALGSGAIHRFDDSLGSLNVTVMRRGEELGWHFDACEAVVSVLLEAAEVGGRFEYVPPLTGSEEDVRAGVARVLRGDGNEAHAVPMEPGDFVLFLRPPLPAPGHAGRGGTRTPDAPHELRRCEGAPRRHPVQCGPLRAGRSPSSPILTPRNSRQ